MPQIERIQNLNDSPFGAYLRCSETQLLHLNEPAAGIFLAESPNVIARALQAGYEPQAFLVETREYRGMVAEMIAGCGEIPLYLADEAVMQGIQGLHLTRGVLCAMRRKSNAPRLEMKAEYRRVVLLENVMNPTNLGAIFRSAAALGMDAVMLTSGCTDPLYRRAARVSMGTVFQIPWGYAAHAADASEAVYDLQGMGYRVAAMALRRDTRGIDDPQLVQAEKLALVLGTEGEGLTDATIEACDDTVKIPMAHGVDSLNVAAASAVAFWAVCGRQKSP